MSIPYIPIISITTIAIFAFFDWHARTVFVWVVYPRRYGHGKSAGRAQKHYKQNWTLFQRLLWVPIFKEWYANKYRFMAYLSYINAFLTLVTVALFLISIYNYPDSKIWIYEYAGHGVFCVLRFVYDNAIAKGQI